MDPADEDQTVIMPQYGPPRHQTGPAGGSAVADSEAVR